MSQNLLVGLGNPGVQYKGTRHNIGFIILDLIAERYGCKFERYKQHGHLATLHGEGCMLFKPTTYMNLSGVAVESVLRHNKVDIENIYVIHDDLEIKRGVVRMQNTPGVHGHNGLRSINSHVGVGYWKIRIGIGRPADNNIHEYVLETMPPKDLMLFGDIGTRIADVLHLLFEHSKQNFLDCVNNVVRPDDAA